MNQSKTLSKVPRDQGGDNNAQPLNPSGNEHTDNEHTDVELRRYFVAVLPTEAVQDQVNTLKRELGRDYDCQPVWNSPPHVNLLAPFERPPDHISRLEHWLGQVAGTMPAFELTFEGLGAFPPRVLFVDVVRSPALMTLQTELDFSNWTK